MTAKLSPVAATLLTELTSGDSHRIWLVAWEIIRYHESQHITPAILVELAPLLESIRQAMREVELGGAFHPNAAVLEQALRVIWVVAEGWCHCAVYAAPNFLLYDPRREERLGLIRVVRTTEPDWHMDYWCQCPQCGTSFKVEQREGHTTWWKWQALPPG